MVALSVPASEALKGELASHYFLCWTLLEDFPNASLPLCLSLPRLTDLIMPSHTFLRRSSLLMSKSQCVIGDDTEHVVDTNCRYDSLGLFPKKVPGLYTKGHLMEQVAAGRMSGPFSSRAPSDALSFLMRPQASGSKRTK